MWYHITNADVYVFQQSPELEKTQIMAEEENKTTPRIDNIEGSPFVTIHLWIDKLMPKLGNPGRYQILLFILFAVNYIPVSFNHVVMGFYGWKFPYTCDPYAGNYTGFQNATLNKCNAILHGSSGNNKTISCTDGQWRFKKEEGEETIVTEYNLVCDREDLINLATTIYFLGVLAGGASFGYLADRFGRKPTFTVCLFAPVVLGVGIRFAPTYVAFVILRFVIGFFIQGLQTTAITSFIELYQSKYRGIAGALSEVMWAIGEVTIAGIAYAFGSWKDIQLAICLPSLVVLIYIAFLPESFRWLLLKAKPEKAEPIIRRMTKFNKLPFPEETWTSVKSVSSQLKDTKIDDSVRKYSFFDLVRTPEVRKRSLIVCYFWFAVATSYYGLIISISNLAGDKHLNMLFSGMTALVGGLSCLIAFRFISRKQCILWYNLIAGVALIISGALPTDKAMENMNVYAQEIGNLERNLAQLANHGPEREFLEAVISVMKDADIDYGTMKKVFAMIGKTAAMGVFTIVILYTEEVFPTVIRTIGFGTGATFGRLGGVLAPQINTLGKYTAKQFPVIFFGALALIAALLVIICPETRFKKLPDTIEDVEKLRKERGEENDGDKEEAEMQEKYTPTNRL